MFEKKKIIKSELSETRGNKCINVRLIRIILREIIFNRERERERESVKTHRDENMDKCFFLAIISKK